MSKFFVVSAVLLALATPALAAEFFIVKDPSTGKCVIATEKPEGNMVMVGTKSYPTKEEAKTAKKASNECKKVKKDGSPS